MADPAFLVAVTGLSLSGAVSATKLISWFLQGDPRAIAQAGRWGATGLFLLSLPLLLGLVINQQWSEAIGLAAVMLVTFALYGPNILGRFLPRRRLKLDDSWPAGNESDWRPAEETATEPEMVRRSIAVLEDYLRHKTGVSEPDATPARASRIRNGRLKSDSGRSQRELSAPALSEAEALEILGLRPEADAAEINEAHRHLMQIVHPDRGGSSYFAVKVNHAKEMLLSRTRPRTGPIADAAPRKRRRRDSQARDFDQAKSAEGGEHGQ
jgi:hypothetical protein